MASTEFYRVHEESPDYGEPFLPCISCGQYRGQTCMLLDGTVVSPWSAELEGLVCLECFAPIQNQRIMAMEVEEE